MGAKGYWTNGKPTEEQHQDFSRLKAVHNCLTLLFNAESDLTNELSTEANIVKIG
jgi:hypothetical protein